MEKINIGENIIERTKEMKEISKQIKGLYDNYVIDSYLAMRRILDFLTLPYSTRFTDDYHCNEEMLVDQRVTVPSLYFTDGEEYKYTVWCCQKVEQGQKILKKYRNITEKMYRYMFDYIIIENVEQRKIIEERIETNFEKLVELAHSKVLDELYWTRQEIWDITSNLWDKKIINDKTTSIEREDGRTYTREVVKNTIKRFPEISKQDIKEAMNIYGNFENINDYEFKFEDIEWELLYDECKS